MFLLDTLSVFNGEAPMWVYAEMAKPLVLLLGTDGYNQMVCMRELIMSVN